MNRGVKLAFRENPGDLIESSPVKVLKGIGTGRWLVLDLSGVEEESRLTPVEIIKRQRKVKSHQLKDYWSSVEKLKESLIKEKMAQENLKGKMLTLKDLIEDIFFLEVNVSSPNIIIPVVDDKKATYFIQKLLQIKQKGF